MPATTLTAQAAPGNWSLTGTAITMTAADTGNANDCLAAPDLLLVAQNTHAVTSYTVTITSTAMPQSGRTGNVAAQTLVAGEIRIFRLTGPGWVDSAGKFNFTASNASVKFGVMQL